MGLLKALGPLALTSNDRRSCPARLSVFVGAAGPTRGLAISLFAVFALLPVGQLIIIRGTGTGLRKNNETIPRLH